MSAAPTYYFRDDKTGADVNAVAGDDANDGLSDANAFQNYSQMASLFNAAIAGTRFLFARGGGWTQAAYVQMFNIKATGTLTSLTRVGTTATATSNRVHNLEIGDTLTIYDAVPEAWNELITITAVPTTTTFEFTILTSPSFPATINPRSLAIHFDGAMIFIEDYVSTEYTQAVDADPYCTYTVAVLSMHTINQNAVGVQTGGYSFKNMHYEHTVAGSASGFFFFDEEKDFYILDNLTIDSFGIGAYVHSGGEPKYGIRLINSTIKNCRAQGILGSWRRALIDNNTFTNNGHQDGAGGVGYHNVYVSYADYTTISNNTLYQSALNAGNASGVSLVAHGVITDLIIEDNYIYEDVGASLATAFGIEVDAGYTTYEEFINTIIRRNKIVNMGNTGIRGNAWTGGTIENNIIIQNQSSIPSIGIKLVESDSGVSNAENTNINIRNNSMYGYFYTAIRANFGTGFNIISNVIESTYTSAFDMLDVGTLSITDTTNFDVIDNNTAYSPSASTSNWEVTQGNLAAWQVASIFDDNSQVADPLYASSSNLQQLEGSPLINFGHLTLSATEDYLGTTRDATPDAGAYEGFYAPSAGAGASPAMRWWATL